MTEKGVLAAREAKLHAGRLSDIRQVMDSKSILVFGEMLDAAGVSHRSQIVQHMAGGFPLVWGLPFDRPHAQVSAGSRNDYRGLVAIEPRGASNSGQNDQSVRGQRS